MRLLTLVASALAGGDCIDDADVLRTGGTAQSGCVVKAPSTLGTFLRSFQWPRPPIGSGQPRARWHGPGRLGPDPATRHSPSTWIRRSARHTVWPRRGRNRLHGQEGLSPAVGRGRWHRRRRMARLREGRQHRSGCRPLPRWGGCATPPGDNSRCGPTAASTPTPSSPPAADGCPLLHHRPPARPPAQSHRGHTRAGLDAHPLLEPMAETSYTPSDAAPVHRPAVKRRPLATYSYHGTGNPGTGGRPSAPRRDQTAIRDRWTARVSPPTAPGGAGDRPQPGTLDGRIGLGEQIVTTKTLRRRFFSMAGRLTRSARRLTLHLPQRWPWEAQFSGALARFRALPLPS